MGYRTFIEIAHQPLEEIRASNLRQEFAATTVENVVISDNGFAIAIDDHGWSELTVYATRPIKPLKPIKPQKPIQPKQPIKPLKPVKPVKPKR
jgi:hypothetical protein